MQEVNSGEETDKGHLVGLFMNMIAIFAVMNTT